MADPEPSPFRLTPHGLAFSLRLTPKASRNAILATQSTPPCPKGGAGELILKATVTAAPEDGKANAALCKLLAKEWQLAVSRIKITGGLTSRNKQLLIEDSNPALKARLEGWIKSRRSAPEG